MPGQMRSPIDKMSYDEIAEYMSQIDGRTAGANGGALTKRLYEIALYDNYIPQSHREGARELLRIIKGTVEQYLTAVSSPDAIKKYREANAEMERGKWAKTLGVGSLAWLLRENKIPDDQIPEFATRPEYSHLLNDFASIMSPDVAARLKSLADEKQSQRLAESKRTADPEFLGNFLTAQLFLQIKFNIAEERFEQI